jgi:hypothetical protein
VRGHCGFWILGLLAAAALGAAAMGVHASSAAPLRGSAAASTIDKTYSCHVRKQHFVDVGGGATIPPANGQPKAPGFLVLTTANKTITRNGTKETLTQVSLQAVKNSLRIDTSACRRVHVRVPLKPKGLDGPVTATPTFRGHINEQCGTAARVLVHLRLSLTNHTPTHALLAIRNDNAKRRPIAFYNWTARKVSAYTAGSCVDQG